MVRTDRAEQHGYDVSYISTQDLHGRPGTLRRARGFLSVGHDEYYTRDMFSHLSDAVEQGLNVAFFSGNSVYGQVTPVPHPPRSMIRTDTFSAAEPDMERLTPTLAYLPHEAPDAKDLIGSRSTYPCMGAGDWTCVRPDHWVLAGSGMRRGDSVPGLVGWETRGLVGEVRDVEVIAAGTVSSRWGYRAVRGHRVPGRPRQRRVQRGHDLLAEALSEPPGYLRPSEYVPRHGPDPRVQAITRNVLGRFTESPRLRDHAP
jgi:hypothetical protein